MEPISDNPYATPQTFEVPPDRTDSAELIRKEHLKTEASLKAVGLFYYLVGIFVARLSLPFFGQYDEGVSGLAEATIGVILMILAAFHLIVGSAIRKLKPWSRIAAGVLSIIGGLLGFPIGTLMNACVLFLIFRKKTGRVLSEPYQTIIAETPHMKPGTSVIVWVVMGIAVLLMGLAFFSSMTRR